MKHIILITSLLFFFACNEDDKQCDNNTDTLSSECSVRYCCAFVYVSFATSGIYFFDKTMT